MIVVFFGDPHVGGMQGLWDPAWLRPQEPHTWPEYLWECWHRSCSEVEDLRKRYDGERFLLCLSGDMIEGRNAKGKNLGLYDVDLEGQTARAVDIFRPLVDLVDETYRVTGTRYHEDYYANLRAFDQELGIDRTADEIVFELDPDGERVSFAHHPPGGSVLYPAGKSQRTIYQYLQAMSQTYVPQGVRWIVRGHLHHSGMVRSHGITAIQLPCWKGQDYYAFKANQYAWHPDIGFGRLYKDSEGDWSYKARVYPRPESYHAIVTPEVAVG